MKFEGSGSKGTRVIERKRSVTDGQTDRRIDGQTDRRTDGQGKNNMSPPEGGRHNLLVKFENILVISKNFKMKRERSERDFCRKFRPAALPLDPLVDQCLNINIPYQTCHLYNT